MRRLLHYFLALISLISLVGLLPVTAQASTPPLYQYLAEKKYQPDPVNHPGIYCNYASEQWAANYWVHTLKWWADPQNNPQQGGMNLRGNAYVVIQRFLAAVPNLNFQETTTQSNADLQFVWDDNTLQPGEAGGHLITVYDLWSPHNAYYPKTVKIMIHSNAQNVWDNAGALQMCLSHEIGHVYGLADRYYTNPADCNPNESTVMDCMQSYLVSNVYHIFSSCDSLWAPSNVDVTRIGNFWSSGSLENLSASANGAVATWTWKDGAWAEWDENLQAFYWNGSGWTCYYNVNSYTNMGAQRSYDNRTLSLTIDHRNYGVPGGGQCLCGWSWFKEFNKFGSWQCKSIYVSP